MRTLRLLRYRLKALFNFQTNAPNHVVWDVMRAWIHLHPPKYPNEFAKILLAKPPTFFPSSFSLIFRVQVDFDKKVENAVIDRSKPRFTMNPKNWGPLARAKAGKRSEEGEEPPKKLKTTDSNEPKDSTGKETMDM